MIIISMLSHVANQQGYQHTTQKTEHEESKEDPFDPGHPFAIKHLKVDDPEYMSEVPEHLQNKEIPGFPSTIVCIGEPGSGKTNVLMNLLTEKKLWKGFFDIVYLFGPTCKTDKLYKLIKVDKEQVVTEEENFLPKLMERLEKQIEEVEKNPKEAYKALFVFEDITSYFHTLQSSPEFSKCFNAIRHHKATAYAHVHKIKAFNRTARMACQHIICFPVNKTEVDVLYQDWAPRCLDKYQWQKLVEDAWASTDDNKKPFLYINKYQPPERRYRKCFTHILDLEYYKKVEKPGKASKKERVGVKEEERDSVSSQTKERHNKRNQELEEDRRKIREHYQAIQRSKTVNRSID